MAGLRRVKEYDADGLTVNKVDFGEHFGATDRCFSFVQFDGEADGWRVVPGAEVFCGAYLQP